MAHLSFIPMAINANIMRLGREIAWDRADISNLIGSISLAFWLCNGIPLVYEIYSKSSSHHQRARSIANLLSERKSADGVSLAFLGLWAIGDILNLAGSIWANLVPTTIFVAIYYIVSDAVILIEAFYYNALASSQKKDVAIETSPLIESPAKLFVSDDDKTSVTVAILHNIGACIGLTLLGGIGWYLSVIMINDEVSGPSNPDPNDHVAAGPQVLGYTSAMLYLCARIPQIIKNYRKQKTEGLALLFFILSVCGNLTYAASILAFSMEREYVITNIPWLMGSLGTLAFDFIILFQFLLYRLHEEEIETEESLLNT